MNILFLNNSSPSWFWSAKLTCILKNKDNNSDNKSDGIKTSLPVDDTGGKNKKVGGLNPKPAMS